MTIAVMTVACYPPDGVGSRIEIHGDGFDPKIEPKDLILSVDGVQVTSFFIGFRSRYIIHVAGLVPSFKTGIWKVKIGTAEFEQVLICPAQNLSGLYYIDRSRARMVDQYNDVTHKIPDPTIRTALLGE